MMKINNLKFYGSNNQKTYQELNKIASTLENYAKSECINIKFKCNPSSADKAEHQLNITVTDNDFFSAHTSKSLSISPDTETITVFQPDSNHSYEENFAKRVFRTVCDLTQSVKKQKCNEINSYLDTVHILRDINR